jgi:hypothetical protein
MTRQDRLSPCNYPQAIEKLKGDELAATQTGDPGMKNNDSRN